MLIRSVAKAYLFRRAMNERTFKRCTGCSDDEANYQPNQEAHMGAGGCLDPNTADDESLYEEIWPTVNEFGAAFLFNQMATHLGVDKVRIRVVSTTREDVDMIRGLATSENLKYPELEELCEYIYREKNEGVLSQ
jgi:hypothetical protein